MDDPKSSDISQAAKDQLGSFLGGHFGCSSVSLIQAGFKLICSNNGQELKCDECNLGLAGFPAGANAFAWHQEFSPDCPFIKRNDGCDWDLLFHQPSTATAEYGQISSALNRHGQGISESGNQDASSAAAQHKNNGHKSFGIPRAHIDLIKGSPGASSMSLTGFNSERQRKLTFRMWPKKRTVSVRELAASGFFYPSGLDPDDDTVECVFCEVRISNWTAEMEPDDVHQKKSTYCPFMQGVKTVKNIPESLSELLDDEDLSLPASDRGMAQNMRIMVESIVGSAKYPKFAVEARRQATFVTWAPKHKKTSTDMIEHQLFYTGKGDTVCCFSCGTEMSGWLSPENIWVRHARTAPHCQLVIQEKGQDYIDEVLTELGRYVEPDEEPRVNVNNVTTRMLRPRMDYPSTVAVLNMGTDREEVRDALNHNTEYGREDFMRQAPLVTTIMKKREEKRKLDAARKEAESTPAPPIVVSPPQLAEEAVEQVTAGTEEVETEQPQPSATGSLALPNMSSYREAAIDLKRQLTCKICMNAPVGIVFLPCGHLVACVNCAVAAEKCPVCKRPIREKVTASLDQL